ncbi:MAG: DUF1287 domain-containing protein [Candidatus Aminicenantes bacterium]|nr:DUF1287 domain-containing protein [Candidatus Aminicenantes bacterium]NIM77717.1 DUF1287 domain-containing protein [Candidatus Aminicenantes bacterium]NIN17030.1 DUF1287 domain-containing protein [Candidatus Aminicenantes bacterium]NIN40923.1 DUF1287 domain-containing protein [Candidatus Aminicenantes bacterium]NIN83728.1 DUF1287 domain-containing protein [Candidatus Aminicenantes bacterium]
MKSQLIKGLLFVLLVSVISRAAWSDRVYSIVPLLNVREKPSTNSKIIEFLRHGRWVDVISKGDEWLKIKMPNGKNGYVFTKLVTDFRVKVLKDERRLLLMKGNKVQQQYPAALGFNPRDDKIKQGDGCTPEGRFYICQIIEKPKTAATYGPVSLRISYPNIEDARRGLKDKLITETQYLAIVKAIHHGRMPPQNTPLGSSIKIHGGDPGVSHDWTLGCVAMKNPDIKQLFSRIPKKLVMVDIYRSRQQEQKYNGNGYVNRRTLEESQKLIKQGCSYTRKATAIIPISYPLGDFDKSIGVCTDVAIRALRGLGIDLQALLYEDIILHPRRYPNISKPNPNIDHRRTRNLKRFFDYHAEILTIEPPAKKPNEWLPGDIVIMDTGIPNGTIYDHIGIVSSRKTREGIPLVVNLWTIGCQLNEMELLNGDYPKIVGHYRLLHPFFYDALK